MEKQTFIEKPVTILDLGTGFSNVHLNISEVFDDNIEEDINKYSADINKYSADVLRVENPVTRSSIISAIINEKFSYDFREAALRKGIENKADADYVTFNNFAEEVKKMVTDAGIL